MMVTLTMMMMIIVWFWWLCYKGDDDDEDDDDDDNDDDDDDDDDKCWEACMIINILPTFFNYTFLMIMKFFFKKKISNPLSLLYKFLY